jgi:hypothetical protein
MEPLLHELEEAGAGVTVDDEKILGFAWSDDLLMLVEEDKLQDVLNRLEIVSGRYKKKTNDSKVFVTPLCKKKQHQPRPTLFLGGKPLKYKTEEQILGFTLSTNLQGGTNYEKKLKAKTVIAAAKIEKIGSGNGVLVREAQISKYYESMFLPVLTANMTAPQLDRPNGDKPGYVVGRQATADILRRMLSTSALTPPTELIAEAGWVLPDEKIILSKLRLMDRLLQREHAMRDSDNDRKAHGERQDAPSAVLRQRIRDVEHGETKGLCAEIKRIWQEAGMSHKWPPNMSSSQEYEDNSEDMEVAAETISWTRLSTAIHERSKSHRDMPYEELWDGTKWRLSNGSRRQVGLMTTARLDGLVMNDTKSVQAGGSPRECPCCGSGFDNLQHALLSCEHPAMGQLQSELNNQLHDLLDQEQQQDLQALGPHETKMFLLGKKLKSPLSRGRQKELDYAMKQFLEQMDDYRTDSLGMNPMCGRTYTRPPEDSLQQAAQWDRMWRQDMTGSQAEQEKKDDSTDPDTWSI